MLLRANSTLAHTSSASGCVNVRRKRFDISEGKKSLVYWKSYKLQYIFYCMLGEKGVARNFVEILKLSGT